MARTRWRRRRRRWGGRRRSRRSRRDGRLLLVLLLAVAVFIAVRSARGDESGAPPGPTTTTAPPPAGSPAALLAALVVAEEADRDGYSREAFGVGWALDANGCDVRNQVLADESRVPVTRAGDGCAVVRGEWLSLYDNRTTPDPDELEIDHVVSLAEAWDSGAASWSADRRSQYANDLAHPDALLAVTAASNQSKSDSDPAEWMPPHRPSWCRFAAAWITQKSAWKLTVDAAERTALQDALAGC
jgi:hypothetical protein